MQEIRRARGPRTTVTVFSFIFTALITKATNKMAEADESSSASVGNVTIPAPNVGTSGATKGKVINLMVYLAWNAILMGRSFSNSGSNDEDVLQIVEEIDHHPECSVCLQPSYYPVKLPCGHIFCFLCIKGVALRSKRCALCRQPITPDFFENPTLVKVVGTTAEAAVPKCSRVEDLQNNPGAGNVESASEEFEEYVWFYEGRNGWWQYDEKTSSEVENVFKTGKRSCTLLIAGFLYTVDFENMFQARKQEPGRRRRIKRDKLDAESKGVAGIRTTCKRTENLEAKSTEASATKDECRQESGGEVAAVEGIEANSSEGSTETSDSAPAKETSRSECDDELASRFGKASLFGCTVHM